MARGKKKPVSGPGRLAERTDGGAADRGVYASPEGERPYGERKAVEEQAAGAPMASEPAPELTALLEQGAFTGTRMPSEPPTAGAPFGPGRSPGPVLPDDPNMLLRAMIEVLGPHPDLVRLMPDG